MEADVDALEQDDLLEVLGHGELEIEGRLVDASNVALLGRATLEGVSLACVYKPTAGERRLWDFPEGTLGLREVATYRLARALGWPLVPETAWRDNGPAGAGMCQRWIDVDDAEARVDVVARDRVPDGWRDVVEAYGPAGEPVALVHADDPALRRLALLDAVANNADRKGGHVLTSVHGAVLGIDHGVTFHDEPKLRTVLWGWAGESLADDERAALAELGGRWPEAGLEPLLSARELRAARRRLARLLSDGVFPYPGQGWPALPWPAF